MGISSSSDAASGGRGTFESIYGPPKGNFLDTTHGSTHCILEHAKDKSKAGPLVVLIHGIGGQSGLFDEITTDLLQRGDAAQVLRYDFYDRGYSESNKTKYPIDTPGVHPLDFTLDLHIQQLRDVLIQLKLTDHRNILLCGHSTGGVTAFGYASKYPANIGGLILMDSVSLPISQPLIARVADLPILGNFLVRRFGAKGFAKFARQSLADPSQMEDFLDKLDRNAQQNPRFFAAVRSTNKNCKGFGGTTAEPEYRQCCEAKIPIHLIWGKEDKATPYSNCCALKAIGEELGTEVSEESFEGMPHNIFFPDAKPRECSKSICDFVAKRN